MRPSNSETTRSCASSLLLWLGKESALSSAQLRMRLGASACARPWPRPTQSLFVRRPFLFRRTSRAIARSRAPSVRYSSYIPRFRPDDGGRSRKELLSRGIGVPAALAVHVSDVPLFDNLVPRLHQCAKVLDSADLVCLRREASKGSLTLLRQTLRRSRWPDLVRSPPRESHFPRLL